MRSQLDIFTTQTFSGPSLTAPNTTTQQTISAQQASSTNSNFVKLEEGYLGTSDILFRNNRKPEENKTLNANTRVKLSQNGHLNTEKEGVDDSQVDLSNPEMTFLSDESNAENLSEQDNQAKLLGANTPLINQVNMMPNQSNNVNNVNLKLNKKNKVEIDSRHISTDEADLDTVNNLYNKLLIHNNGANKSTSVNKMDDHINFGIGNPINEQNENNASYKVIFT